MAISRKDNKQETSALSANQLYASEQLQANIIEDIMVIWAEILKSKKIRPEDHFFHLGGSSLQAAILVNKLEIFFRCRFSLSMIYLFPTVEDQARLVQNNQEDPAIGLYENFLSKGVNPIFWILCRFNESEVPFVPFDTYFDQSPTEKLNGISLEMLAAEYVARICSVPSNKPFRLGGYSVGGLLAIEVARQLKQQGMEVDLLFLVDPMVPGAERQNDSVVERLQRFSQQLLSLDLAQRLRYAFRVVWFYIPKTDFGFKEYLCNYLLTRKIRLPKKLWRYYAKKIYDEAASTPPQPFIGNTIIYFRKRHPSLEDESWKKFCPDAEIRTVDTFEHDDIVSFPWNKIWLKDLQIKLTNKE